MNDTPMTMQGPGSLNSDAALAQDIKAKRAAYMRAYTASGKGQAYNRAKVKAWRKKNKAPHAKRMSGTRCYREVIINTLLQRDGLICGICKQSLENSKIEIDHIQPIALGGPNIMSNLRLAHPTCNRQGALAIRKERYGH